MEKDKQSKAKSVLIYAFYGEKQDELLLTNKSYKNIEEDCSEVYTVPKVEIKENESAIDAVTRFMKTYDLNFVPMEDQDEVNIPCYIDPNLSNDCVCTVYGSVDNRLYDLESGLLTVDEEGALHILEEENVDIATYYLLLMFVAGCMK